MHTIGIIGGKGKMGSFFAGLLKKNGFKVIVSDIDTPLSNKKLVQLSDIIIVAVPIHKTKAVIRHIIPFTHNRQLIADVTSLKVFPINEMLKGKARVIGMHPMFRPSVSMKGQHIVLCPARCSKADTMFFKKIFAKEGGKTITMTAKEHDQLMATVQVLIHFHSLVLGQTLRQLKPNMRRIMQVMSPIYRLQFDVVSRIFSQDPYLYASIGIENDETKKITSEFAKQTSLLQNIMTTKSYARFFEEFKKTKKFLGPHAKKALEESDALIEALSGSLIKKPSPSARS